MLKIVVILLFCLFCNVMSSTVLTCLEHANSFVCSTWISIYTSLAVGITIGNYFYDVQNFINVTEKPKKYASNNQTSKISHFMRTYIYVVDCWRSTWRTYIRPWLLTRKYFCLTRNSKRKYIYVLGCWSADRVGAAKTHQGRIYTSLAVGKKFARHAKR